MSRPPRLRSPRLTSIRVRARPALAASVAAVAVLGAACASGPDTVVRHPGSTTGTAPDVATTRPPAPTDLPTPLPIGPDGLRLASVVLRDEDGRSTIDAPDVIAAGPLAVEVVNDGAAAHDLTVLRLRPGLTIDQLDALLTGPAPEAASKVANLLGGAGTLAPKQRQTFALPLEPGVYELASMERDADGHLGVTLGLHRRLRVVGPPAEPGSNGTPPLPTVIGAVGLRDDGMDLPESWPAGWYRVSNTGGQVHDLTLTSVNDGVKPDDVKQWLRSADNGPPPTPAPFTFVGGAAPLDGATSVWVKLALPSGLIAAWDDQLDRAGAFAPFREAGSFATFTV